MTSNTLPPHRIRRISLTKTQLRTELGAELLSLCESVTADGVVRPDEVEALRQWLDDSADVDLPAASYLREVVSRVIADGRITQEECREIYRAIEVVLPPEVRRQAVAARRTVEATARSEVKAARQQERAARAKNRPTASANFMVAGVRYEGRPAIIAKHAHAGDSVRLVREHSNRYSRHAIAVLLGSGQQIGYVPEMDAQELAPLADQGAQYVAYITKILTGGRSPIPVVQAYLYGPEATVADARPFQGSSASLTVASRGSGGQFVPNRARSSAGRWALWLLAVAVIIGILVAGR